MERLSAMGVRLMQGYLFNAPDYAEMVDPGRWFGDWSTRQDASVGLLPAH
jgi:EAL domain-containing protein (putative c-di-GMP-specific phosphodiesterase class I)